MNKDILKRLAAKKAPPSETEPTTVIDGGDSVMRRFLRVFGIEMPDKPAPKPIEANHDEGTISNARELLKRRLKRLANTPPIVAPVPGPAVAPPTKARVNEPVVRRSCCGMQSESCCAMPEDASIWQQNTAQPHVKNMPWTPRSTRHGPY